jgi:hypothetical protein
VRTAETGQVRNSREKLQPTTAAICIFGLGLDFLLLIVGISDQSWLSLCISHGWLLVFFWKFSIKVKVLKGGVGLWLGDNIVILFMVKRAHPLLSNRLWAHTIFWQSNH